jgi:hypothetical protein
MIYERGRGGYERLTEFMSADSALMSAYPNL